MKGYRPPTKKQIIALILIVLLFLAYAYYSHHYTVKATVVDSHSFQLQNGLIFETYDDINLAAGASVKLTLDDACSSQQTDDKIIKWKEVQ